MHSIIMSLFLLIVAVNSVMAGELYGYLGYTMCSKF